MIGFDAFLWWSGLATWIVLGIVGMLALGDRLIDFIVSSVWTKREFLEFVWERLRKRRPDDTIPAG